MANYRAQISFQLDTLFPRDAMTINPHYSGVNPQALADALITRIAAIPAVGATQPMTVKVYDADKAPPSYPLASATAGSGTRASGWPREVALCLSYYSGFNRPSLRGRLYIPGAFSQGSAGVTPTTTQQDNILAWCDALIVGTSIATWEVYSKKNKSGAGPVTHAWVDNEWDTQRSRGLRADSRVQRAVTQN